MATDTPNIPTRAIIYCRISRDKEGAGLGIERQREDCEALAKQLGVEVVAFYPDNDLSAYSGKPRPGYRKMLEDLRAGHADTVLAWHTDRLHRSPAELEEYIDVCEPRGIATQTVKAGHLDLTTATGRMIARQLGVQARYEVERMIERQRRKRDEMARNGKFFGGRRPFGYEPDGTMPRSVMCLACGRDEPEDFLVVIKCQDCDGTQFDGWACSSCKSPNSRHVWCECKRCGQAATVADDSEFARIRQAADAILAGTSLRSLAAEWNELGVPTSTGGDWEGPEVRSMLLRPRNAGILKHRGQEAGPGNWPAALDEPTWRSLVGFLSDEARRLTTGNTRKYLGSGLFECGICADGTTVRAVTSNKDDRRHLMAYSCRKLKHVVRKVEPLDEWVVTQVLERLQRDDAADLLAEREDPVDVKGAQQDMREARQTLDELAEALGSGEMSLPEWRTASKAARARLERAESTLSHAVEVNPVAGLAGAEDVVAAWNQLDLSRQRAVVASLMTVRLHPARRGRVKGGGYFDPATVEIVWKGSAPEWLGGAS